MTTGAELFGGPTTVAASYPGTGAGSAGGVAVFDPKQYEERAALLLQNGVVYTTWTSHCDVDPYTGRAATILSAPTVPAGSHYIRVKGENTSGAGAASDEVLLVVSVPGPSTGLTFSSAGSSVTLSWTAPILGARRCRTSSTWDRRPASPTWGASRPGLR